MSTIRMWFKRQINKIILWSESDKVSCDTPKASSTPRFSDNGVTFVVYNATGGKVIQSHVYDPRSNSTKSSLYIISDSDSFTDELSLIITKEALLR